MTVAVAVNAAKDVVAGQTTWMLALAAARRGHDVVVFGVADWSLDGLALAVRGYRVALDSAGDRSAALARSLGSQPVTVAVGPGDVLLLRTNPARDPGWPGHHEGMAAAARVARESGLRVINDPDALALFGTKLGLALLQPAWRPQTRVATSAAGVRQFVAEHGPSVVKPASGSRGRGVLLLDRPHDPNLTSLVELLAADGPVIVQKRVTGAEAGDVRVIVVDGRVLEVDGHVAAIARRPAAGELRSNIHAGGAAEPAELSDAQRRVASEVATFLAARGVRVAGLDLIGARVIEVNVYSPGGLRDAERFAKVDFSGALIERLLS